LRIKRVEISNFRGLGDVDLDLDGRSVFVIGENGSGKTALLVAIARGLGRDLSFRRPDFTDANEPIEITATLDDLSGEQRAVFGDHVDFVTGGGASLRVRARAVWDESLEDVEVEHLYVKNSQRSRRDERDAVPLLWLPANRDVTRVLQFGGTRSLMTLLLEELPIGSRLDKALGDIQSASERFGAAPEIKQFLDSAAKQLADLVPDIGPSAYSLGLAATTGHDLLRQFELALQHTGDPIRISQQSSGLAQLTVFVFALALAASEAGALLLIDEPEISLHPQAQRALVKAFRALNAQILLATHSSNLLERVDPRFVVRIGRVGGQTEFSSPKLSKEEGERFARFTDPHASEAFFARAVLLVEGESDRLAVEAIAERKGRNLDADGVTIVPINGITKAPVYIDLFGPHGLNVKMAGLYDESEEAYVLRGVERSEMADEPNRADLERLGFLVCQRDLEDELVRALGGKAAKEVVEGNGDLGALELFSQQPAYKELSLEEQVVAFIQSGRKSRKVEYAPLLVDAIPESAFPAPLEKVLQLV
jgi:predicted ATP-dependent endonuclease of OLD family